MVFVLLLNSFFAAAEADNPAAETKIRLEVIKLDHSVLIPLKGLFAILGKNYEIIEETGKSLVKLEGKTYELDMTGLRLSIENNSYHFVISKGDFFIEPDALRVLLGVDIIVDAENGSMVIDNKGTALAVDIYEIREFTFALPDEGKSKNMDCLYKDNEYYLPIIPLCDFLSYKSTLVVEGSGYKLSVYDRKFLMEPNEYQIYNNTIYVEMGAAKKYLPIKVDLNEKSNEIKIKCLNKEFFILPSMKLKATHNDDELLNILNAFIKTHKGYYAIGIKDLKSGREIYINNASFTSASVIKVYVMIEAYHQVKDKKLRLDEKLTLLSSKKVPGTGTLRYQKSGKKYTVEELIRLMITISDNTATNMLIERLGKENINNTIKSLGCTETKLANPLYTKLPKGVTISNRTSVKDLVIVFDKLYNRQCLGAKYDNIMLKLLSQVENKNKLVKYLPKGTIVAHKTGSVGGHEHDAGIIYGPDKDFIICVMSKNVSNTPKSQANLGVIARSVYEYYRKK